MIVAMNKYSFLVYHKEYLDFLKGVQELGVLHVIEKDSGEIADEALREKYLQVNELGNAINFLSKFQTEEKSDSTSGEGLKVLEELNRVRGEQEKYLHELAQLKKEKSALLPWGDFSWQTIEKINNAGYFIDFFMCSGRNFKEEWQEEYDLVKVNDTGGNIYFTITHKEEISVEIDAELVKLPENSLSKVETTIQEIEGILEKTEEIYARIANTSLALLEATKEKLSNELAFDKVVLTTPREAEERLRVLEGWVPKDKEEAVNEFLEKSGIYYEAAKPDLEEAPPIKLKNSGFASLFESIGELYTFPNYKELDLTPFFAPFYMLFFGFCLGDAGYGLLITLGTIYGLTRASAKVKPLLKLGMFLGISTTIMGIIGGTFFGIMLHPDDYKSTYELAPWIKEYQQYILSSDNLMKVALGLGYIQVVFGMFLNAANRARMYGFKFALSQLGWNIIVLITLPAFALLKMNIIPAEIGKIILIVSAVLGGVPAFFYNTPGKNPLLNLGVGLWDTYQVASGLLGDILSYIRLFALGLSSAILGNVFNQLAMQSSKGVGGVAGILVLILILAFGHGLNFFMAALGSFVHPLRLTFVEFYKNAGFMGGGKKYDPLKN